MVEMINNVGQVGEDIAVRYLRDRGFEIITRNYRRKWGEIDVLAKRTGILRFVEVKTVSREKPVKHDFSRETNDYRPEENVHPKKLERLHRAIQTYLAEKGWEDSEWQLDVLAIELDPIAKTAHCRFLENIV